MAAVENAQPRVALTSLQRVVVGAILGGTIEWFDYFIYASASALIFGKLFFTGSSPLVGTLASYGTFAVGQFMRPIGAIILGNLGDRIGRKPILVTTFILMGGSTFAIGLLPTYATVGVLAPCLLVFFRLLQGFGAGAEYAGASIMMLEYAPQHRRGLYGSTGSIGSAAGLMFGTLVFTLLQLLPDSTLLNYAWRFPFFISAVLVAVGLWVRTRVAESPMFERVEEEEKVEKLPLKGVVEKEWRSLVQIFALASGLQMGTYIFLTYIISYLTNQEHFRPRTATNLVFLAGIAATVVTPLFGRLSDSYGRKKVFGGAALLAAICVFPYFWLIDTGNVVLAAIAVVVLGGIVIQAMAGVQGSLFGEVFSTKLRYSGFAVGREVSAAIFGGLSPVIATALVAATGGAAWGVSIYLIAVLLLTFVATLIVPETYESPLKL
jgi:MFS transporter, MHS family, shikimate and dehydroshikimate transport protein